MRRQITDLYPVKIKGETVWWSPDDKSPGYTPRRKAAPSLGFLVFIGAGFLALMAEVGTRLGF
ncbi:MAG: hypothetical protein ACFCUR_20920 [Rhodomicrobiaceae bacterium]